MKNVGGYAAGYTILEVMIFLAVSGAMFLIAIAFINGKQSQAEFSQSVGDIGSQLQQVLDNVVDGYYASQQSFNCSAGTGTGNNGGPDLLTGNSGTKGTHDGCIYIGEVVQFGVPGSNGQKYNIIPVVGNQTAPDANNVPQPVTSFSDAYPTAFTSGVEAHELSYGMYVTDMYLMPGKHEISGFGVFTTFGGSLNSGAQSIQIATVPGLIPANIPDSDGYVRSQPFTGASSVVNDIKDRNNYHTLLSSEYISVCLKSGYNKPASVSLGNSKGSLSVQTQTGASVATECLS